MAGWKTTLIWWHLYGLVRQGYSPAACNVRADYIDSMFHSRVLGIETGNPDSLPMTVTLRSAYGRQADIHVIEGA